TQHVARLISPAFPVPQLIMPAAAGIDISDSSVKWLSLKSSGDSLRVAAFGERALPHGVIEDGVIHDIDTLAEALKEVKRELGGVQCAHAALPEEPAYVFGMHVPSATA